MSFLNCRLTLLGLGISVSTVCIGCQIPSGSQMPQVPVNPWPKSTVNIEMLRQPQRVERSISLAGSVTQRVSLLNSWLYQIDDGTGQVWVLTQQSAPNVGQQVYVDGVLRYEAIPINGADLGDYYLEEKQYQLQLPEIP